MRGLCALYVAACHAYLMYGPEILQASSDPLPRSLVFGTMWLAFGRLAVTVFIVISGYCLMLPVVLSDTRTMTRTWFQFMRRRARRLLPPYFGALAVSIFLIATIPSLADPAIGEWNKSFPALTIGSILSHLALMHNFSADWQYSINHPMWSIATEWQIYFFFPGLVYVWYRFGVGKLIIVSLTICLALMYFLIVFWPENNPWPPQFFALFGLGMAGAAYNHPGHDDEVEPKLRSSTWGVHTLWLFLLAISSNIFFFGEEQEIPDFLMGGATVCAMIYLTRALQEGRQPLTLCLLEWRPLVRLGQFSYSLYLLHAPILALFFLMSRELGLGAVTVQLFILGIGLPSAVLFSYLFYLAVEKPFLNPRSA